jgi:hypothetical protein
MSPILSFILMFLPVPIAVAIFVFSNKNPHQRYLLGLIPILLFWQVVSVLFLWYAKTPCEEWCGFFETGAGALILVLIVSYTVLGPSLRRFYHRAVRKTQDRERSLRSLARAELRVCLAILGLSVLCGLGLTGFTLWSVNVGNPILSILFSIGYGNYILLKQGVAAFIIINVLILALFIYLYTRFGKKLPA